jgi:hypothetical protein
MINLKKIVTPLGLGLTLWGVLSLPAKADRVIIINQPSSSYPHYPRYPRYPRYPYYQNPNPSGNFIYGSPISTPIPVNPYTGHSTINQNNYPNQNRINYPYNNRNNRVIYYNNSPYNQGYYTPNTGSSFYYNSSGGMYLNIGY